MVKVSGLPSHEYDYIARGLTDSLMYSVHYLQGYIKSRIRHCFLRFLGSLFAEPTSDTR